MLFYEEGNISMSNNLVDEISGFDLFSDMMVWNSRFPVFSSGFVRFLCFWFSGWLPFLVTSELK